MGRLSHHGRNRGGLLSNLFRGLFSGESPGRQSSRRTGRPVLGGRQLCFEACEERHLLSIPGVSFSAGVLTLQCSTSAEAYSVIGSSSYVNIYSAGTFLAQISTAAGNVSSVVFDGGGSGANSLNLQNLTGLSTSTNVTLQDLGSSMTLSLSNCGNSTTNTVQVSSSGSTAGLALGTTSLAGSLNITTPGALTQSGPVTVKGTTTLDATGSGNNITLANPGNSFSTVDIVSGSNVSLKDVSSIGISGTVSGALAVQANLNPTSRTAVTESGSLTVDGTTTITVGPASSVALVAPSGDTSTLDGAVSVTAGTNATIANTTATILDTSKLSGNLTVTSGGAVTQTGSGTLTVGKVASFTATGNSVTVNNSGNSLGTFTVPAAGSATVTNAKALTLGTSSIGAGGLTVTTAGALSQSGALVVTGATSLTAGSGNNITLSNAGNDFTGAVTIVSGKNITLRNAAALTLGASSTVSGTLSLTAAGLISAPSLTVGGTTTVSAGAGNNVTLDGTLPAVAVSSGDAVTLTDTGALVLGASKITGNLVVTAAGTVTQSGAISVAGTTTLTASTGSVGGETDYNITLNSSANSLTGAVSVVPGSGANGGQNVTLVTSAGMVLGNVTISGNLALQANMNSSSRVALAQTSAGVLIVGTSSAPTTTTLTVGPASTITLANYGNDFSGDVAIIGPKSTAGAANATLASDAEIIFGGSNVSGNLTVTSTVGSGGTGITQDTSPSGGPLVVGKVATLSAPLADIVLTQALNKISTLTVPAAGSGTDNVTVTNAASLVLGGIGAASIPIPINDNLTVTTTSGSITQGSSASGALNVTGTTSLTAAGSVALTNSANVMLGDIAINCGGNALLSDLAPVVFAGSTIDGTLYVNAGSSSISQDDTTPGPLTVGGAATLIGNGITLNHQNDSAPPAYDNDLSTVSFTSAGPVEVDNAVALVLGASSITGGAPLTVQVQPGGGGITQSGPLNIDGSSSSATISFSADSVDLPNPANYLTGPVSLNTNLGDATLVVINSVELSSNGGAASVAGDLNVTAGGGITQDASGLTVYGNTTLAANPAANINLDNANAFTGAVSITSGNNVTIGNNANLILGTSTITQSLSIVTTGSVSQSGAVRIGTSAAPGTLTLDASGDVTMTPPSLTGNFIPALVVTFAPDVTLETDGSLLLEASTVIGNLTLTAGGNIKDNLDNTGATAVTVYGTTTLTTAAPAGIIDLGDTGSQYFGAIFLTGNDVTVYNDTATMLGTCNVSGYLTVTCVTSLTNEYAAGSYGTINVTGAATLTVSGTGTLTMYETASGSNANPWVYSAATVNIY
jgi:hypothetical protein